MSKKAKTSEMDISKRFNVPHTYVLIFGVIVLITILTYIVPAGLYEKVLDPNTGRNIVDVNSFKYVENTPVSPFGMIQAIPKGMVNAASIVFFVFIIGGSFTMIQSTGAIDTGVMKAIDKLKNREKFVIPLVMFLFSILGFTIGAAEEVIPFVPITILIARGLGYDDIVGVAMVSTGAAIGFVGGMLNPFTTGIAQGIAELPLYSGIIFRTVGYVFFYIVGVGYVLKYANIIKKDPTKSVLYGIERDEDTQKVDFGEFSNRHKAVLIAVLIGLGIMIYGVMKQGWYINQLSAIFLVIGIVANFIGGKNANDAAKSFVKGAKDIAFGALVIGLARTILVVMQEGQIMDSIIYMLSVPLKQLPSQVTSVGMFVVNSIINFFIPSGSGQAATMMPIMSPLADVVGITRQTATLSLTYGDAITNQIIPTSGALLGILGLSKVPYERWVKYNWKLVVIWTVMAALLLIVASTIQLGPF